MATSPITEPTDRSIPPVMMTTVMPMLMIASGAKLRVTFVALSAVPKVGSNQVMKTTRAKSATATQNA